MAILRKKYDKDFKRKVVVMSFESKTISELWVLVHNYL
jgi:hypothetical protein